MSRARRAAQASQASPSRHAPAVVLAIVPNIAAWGQTQVDGALAAAGTSAAELGYDTLMGTGVVYHGMEAGRRRGGARRPGAGRDRRLHHRPPVPLGRSLCSGGRDPRLLRLHPWGAAGVRRLAAGRARLCVPGHLSRGGMAEEPAHGRFSWEPPAGEEKAPAE